MGIFLNCGRLKTTSGVLGDYKIEWRLGSTSGEIVFITGEGTDTSLQAQHPLVDEVVQAGNLYPTINYIYIDGNKITSVEEIGSLFSPDLLECLDFITVDAAGCTVDYNPNGVYNFVLNYENTTDVGDDKSRVLNYNISPTTNYLAWQFDASTIADGIKIYYCTELDPAGILLDNYIGGFFSSNNIPLVNDFNPIDYPNNPKTVSLNPLGISQYSNSKYLKMLTNLTGFTYTTGDYIKVEIIGSVLDPTNTNTNWSLGLACVDSFDKTTFNSLDIGRIDLSTTPTLSYNTGLCWYELSYKLLEPANPLVEYSPTNIDLLKYLNILGQYRYTDIGTGTGFIDMYTDSSFAYSPWKLGYSSAFLTNANYICQDLPGTEEIQFNKTNGNLEIVFSNLSEYNDAVTDIEETEVDADFIAAQSSSPTDYKYYTYWSINGRIAISCGDTSTASLFIIHHTSVISYNASNLTINFTCPTITNQYPDNGDPCDTIYNGITNKCTEINNTAIQVTSYTSGITHTHPIGCMQFSPNAQQPNPSISHREYILFAELYDDLISPAELEAFGFCLDNGIWRFYKQYDRLTFTDTSTPEARLTNWTLERQKRLRTGLCTDLIEDANYELVYTAIPTTTTTTTI